MRCTLAAMGLGLLALSTTGCYATWDVAPREVTKLHRYVAPKRVELSTSSGGKFDFNQDTELQFHQASGVLATRYSEVEVRGDVLHGRDEHGVPALPVDLRRVDTVRASRLSPGGTAGLVIGVTTGAMTVGGLMTFAVFATSRCGILGCLGTWGGYGGDAFHAPLKARRR
jgi:hypothetical protein